LVASLSLSSLSFSFNVSSLLLKVFFFISWKFWESLYISYVVLLLEVDITMHILFVCMFSDGTTISFWCSLSYFLFFCLVVCVIVVCRLCNIIVIFLSFLFCANVLLIFFLVMHYCLHFGFFCILFCVDFGATFHVAFVVFCNNFYAFALRFFF
jgi:hypothetical protein